MKLPRFLNDMATPENPAPVMSITVAITAHNEGKWVGETIESVLRQTYQKIGTIKVVAVNDGSRDDTGSVIDSYKDRGVIAIHHAKPSGRKAYAANSALEITDTDLFLALDADAILADNAIEQSIKRFANPKVVMVGGCVAARFTDTLWERARLAEYLYAFSAIKPAQSNTFGLMISSGCFSIIRTERLKELGGYSGRTLGEDLDLTLMCHAKRWKIVYAHDAVCTVVDPHTGEDFRKQVSRWNHSFIQNFRVRRWNPFSGNPIVGFMLYFYLLWTIIGPFFLPVVLFAVAGDATRAILWFFGSWAVMVWLPIVIKARQLKVPMSLVAKSIIPLFIAQYVNVYLFAKTLVKELVLRQTEDGWQRGHS